MKHRIKKLFSQTPPVRPHTIAVHKWTNKACLAVMIFFLFLLTACQPANTKKEKVKAACKPVLVVHVHDYSMSAAPISYFDSVNARELYYAIAAFSGSIKHVGIYTESVKQNILTVNISHIDTTEIKSISNVYLASKIKAKNSKVVQQFQKQAQIDIASYIAKTSSPATEKNTDLATAFQLASIAASQANYSSYSKYMLVTSDLRDCPKKGHPRLQPLQLSNTTVLLIRPALTQNDINHLFPSCPVHVFTTTSDAINFISNNQNQ